MSAAAAASQGRERRILHLSDPHFGTEQPHVVDDLLRLAPSLRADVLVLTGDITQRARRRQFDAARRFVDALRLDHALVQPGNHDLPLFAVWERVWRPYRGFRRAFGDDLEARHADADLLLLGVNTTRAWRHKHGEVSLPQVQRVCGELRAATARQLRVVLTHQPAQVPRDDARKDLLRGHQAALRAWTGAGADLVLGGHIHLPGVMRTPTSRDEGPRAWVVLAGTAVSRRVRREVGPSFNLVRWWPHARRVDVERWDHEGAVGWRCVGTTVLEVHREAGSA
jgi:3',5'-cyclic AMP phosphodiesterase CpdA